MIRSRKAVFHKIFLLAFAAIIFHAVWLMVSDDIGVLRFFTVLSNLLLGVAASFCGICISPH